MGVSRGSPGRNLKMIVIFCSTVKYPKFSVAPSAITIITPNFTLKRRKTATIFIFCQRVKNWQFFSTQLACNAINFVFSRKFAKLDGLLHCAQKRKKLLTKNRAPLENFLVTPMMNSDTIFVVKPSIELNTNLGESASRSLNSFCFIARFSTIASTTRSADSEAATAFVFSAILSMVSLRNLSPSCNHGQLNIACNMYVHVQVTLDELWIL